MKIGIIGAGFVGQSLGKAFLRAGHAVMFSSRDPQSAKMQTLARETGAMVGTVADTVAFGDVLAIAMGWNDVPSAVAQGGNWHGKILIDPTNRLTPGESGKSAAEDLAALTGARVVKAFNTIGAEHYLNPSFDGVAATMLVAGDDTEAKRTVIGLSNQLGFDTLDAGPLAAAVQLENLAGVWIHLAFRTLLGRDIAFRLMRR